MNELIVSKNGDGLRIAIVQDKKIVELQHEKLSEAFSVGDLFVGRVRKINPGLNAAFVDVGYTKDGFLHYHDLGPQVRSMLKYLRSARSSRKGQTHHLKNLQPLPDINKHGKITDVLKPNQEILVQIAKEPISTKGHRLASEISLPGQYVVLVPFSNVLSVSKKLSSGNERRRLRVLAESLCPQGFGIIVRTAAEGKDAASLSKDISDIMEKWDQMTDALSRARSPQRVMSESNRTNSILRDMLSEGFDSIICDDPSTFTGLENYLKEYQPEMLKRLRLYKGKVSLFHYIGIEKQIKASFGKVATMPNGAYLVIEHTEAMHVIDVNSGSKTLKGQNLEDTALRVNMEAATEVARQLRLRDMGGIIVVDFIDLKQADNRRTLNNHMREAMKNDRAKHSILPVSKFGLAQITRQRVRPQLNIQTSEDCPSCNGSGKIKSSMLLADEISNNIDFLLRQNNEKKLSLRCNPYVASYLKQGWLKSYPWQWFKQYRIWITITSDPDIPFTKVHYYNSNDEEINL